MGQNSQQRSLTKIYSLKKMNITFLHEIHACHFNGRAMDVVWISISLRRIASLQWFA